MPSDAEALSLDDREWRAAPGASGEDIEAFVAALPFQPPREYIALLALSNGGEGELALPPLWFQLYDISDAIRTWQDPCYRSEFPKLFFFGTNGGLESIAFDMSYDPPWPIVMLDRIAGPDSAERIAPNMASFLAAVGIRSPDAT